MHLANQTKKRQSKIKKRHQHDPVSRAYDLYTTQKTYGKSPSEMFDYHIKYKRRHIKEKLKYSPTLQYYSNILAVYEPALRQKSLQRLLQVFVQLLYDYSSSAGIYQRVWQREQPFKRDPIEFLQKIQTADVQEIIDASKYTSRSYAYIVRIIAKMIQLNLKHKH